MKKIYSFAIGLLLAASTSAQVFLTESFDANTTPAGWTNTATSGGPWEFGNNLTNPPGYDVSGTPDHTGNNGYYAWMDFSGTDVGVVLETPRIFVNGATNIVMEFFFESYYSGSLSPFNILYIEAWDGTTWVGVDTLQGNTAPGWEPVYEALGGYTYFAGDSLKVRFRAESGGASNDFNNDLLIDDISIYQPAPYDLKAIAVTTDSTPSCGTAPVNVMLSFTQMGTDTLLVNDTVVVSYTDGNNTITENLVLAANMLPGDTLTHTFTVPFTPAFGTNTLVAWIAYPADTMLSNDTVQTSMFTRPQVTQFPYVEDFENGMGGWSINNTQSGTWAFGTPNNGNIVGANSGVNAWGTGNLTGNYNNNEYSWVESPCFDLSQLCNPVIELAINVHSENSWDGAALQASTDGGANWITIGQFNDPYNWYNDNTISGLNSVSNGEGWTGSSNPGWMIAKNSLGAVAGQSSVILRIVFGSDGVINGYDGFAFDDVKIYEAGQIAQNVIMHCGQDSVQLSVYASPSASVQWSTGDTTASIYVYNSGTYSVLYSDTNACPAGIDTVEVYMIAMPMTVNLGNDTNICDGSSITLDAGIPYSTYNWSTGDTTQTITTSQPGGYMVIVTNECGTDYDNIQVGINPLPVVDLGMDSIVDQGYVLDAGSGFTSYLWNNGATTQTITVLNSGDYSVTVTDANGCSNSDTISLWITGIEELAAQFGAKVYPNPSQGQFTIQLPDSRVELTATITDMTGKAVYTQILANQTTYQINLTGLAKGVYFLNLSDGQKSVTQKLIIK